MRAFMISALCVFLGGAAVLARADLLYASAAGRQIYLLDTATRTATLLSTGASTWADIAFSPAGVLFASDGAALFRVQPATGASTWIGDFGAFVNGLTYLGDTLYASGGPFLFTVDTATAALSIVGLTGFASSGDLALYGGCPYLTASGSRSSDLLVQIDPATGQGTLVGPIGFPLVYGLVATPSGLLGLTEGGALLQIDTRTGAGTPLAWFPAHFYGAAVQESVPEPGTLLLLGGGLLALGHRVRRR